MKIDKIIKLIKTTSKYESIYSGLMLKKDVDILHGVCTFLLSLWIVIYSCLKMKKIGIYIIASTISTVIALISLHNHRLSKILLIPLLAWLIVAFQLNWNIVN